MSTERDVENVAVVVRALWIAAALLLVLAALSDPALVARFHIRSPLSSEALAETSRSRAVFGAGGVLLLVLGLLVKRRIWPRGRPSRVQLRWIVALVSASLPLVVLERGARPFVERLTSIFQLDPELGWTHRPLAEDTYWGARVRINSRGMRGPERPLAKPDGVRRVLVLGDSVVFGLMLEDDAETFPVQLERELAARAEGTFECWNTAVCGWSTRQQRRFLERNGDARPDLVVLGFVLNDVTELVSGSGAAQLAYSRPEGTPRWLANSGIHLALRELAVRRALAGDSAEAIAHRSRLTPYHVILQPDSDPVQAAWRRVLSEIEAILAWCRAREVPLVLVAFPFAIQLRDPRTNAPQRILGEFSSRRELPFLDLLPPLVTARHERGLSETDLFFDGLHPTALGHELAAAELARFLVDGKMLP